MMKYAKVLTMAVFCGQAILFFPSQAMAGDGRMMQEDMAKEEYPSGDVLPEEADVEVYTPDINEPMDAYDDNVAQVSEASRQEDWDRVTTGDWEQQDTTGDNVIAYHGMEQGDMPEEMPDNAEQPDNGEPVEEPDLESEAAEPEADLETSEAETPMDISAYEMDIVGDVNGDGSLDAVDCALLQKFIQGRQAVIDKGKADFNGDGQISMLDVHGLLNVIKSEGKGTGDVNDDGKIDGYDIQAITAYMAKQTVSVNRQNADLNGDGEIDGKDLEILMEVLKIRSL